MIFISVCVCMYVCVLTLEILFLVKLVVLINHIDKIGATAIWRIPHFSIYGFCF